MRRAARLVAAASTLLAVGCVAPPTGRAPDATFQSTGKVLYVGAVYDLRETPPAPRDEGADLLAQREVRIPIAEVRSVLADGLERAGLFARVVNPPAAFAGDDPEELVKAAQESSDLLLVAEVNQLHIKHVGFNARAGLSVPLDLLFAPLAFATYVTTAGNMYLFTGALLSCWTAEVVLTMSVSVVDVATGHVVRTVRLEERAQTAYDGLDAFGSFWDDSDDWIDLGRRLGEVALHNAAVRLAARLNAALPR